MGKKIGIDLGTTYSVVSYVDDTGIITNVESNEGEKTTPSIVFFDLDGTVVVGSQAREAGALNPERIIERVKNYMGDPNYMKEIDGKQLSASAISSIILKKLISDTEKWLGNEEIDGAVITCPAYFGDAAREATKNAGEAVELSNGTKLNVLKIMDEPTAAAIAYGNSHPEDMHKTVLIYDLGGGTFDCTVMRLDFDGTDRKYQVITTGGDHHLGGKDWDKALADHIREEFCSQTGSDEEAIKNDPEQVVWFSEKSEALKKMLTQKESATVTPNYDGQKARIEVTREKFNELTAGLFSQTTMLIDQMLEKKGMTMAEIDEIILVGGSTRMKQVEEGLTAYYNKPLVSFDPDKAVSNGAALVASGMNVDSNFGSNDQGNSSGNDTSDDTTSNGGSISLEQPIKFDGAGGTTNEIIELCTKSYCLRYFSNNEPKFLNLVKKDTPKPAHGTTANVIPNLTVGGNSGGGMFDSVNLCIMENEELTDDVEGDRCTPLYEEMPIPFTPPVPGDAPVEVTLDVDINGQLILTLIELNTGVKHEVHPVRRGGDAASKGLEEVSKFTLA